MATATGCAGGTDLATGAEVACTQVAAIGWYAEVHECVDGVHVTKGDGVWLVAQNYLETNNVVSMND